MLPALLDLIAIEPTDTRDLFVSKINPRPLGNRNPLAYGGCIAAYAVHAASLTVSRAFHTYSVLGTFLGPGRVTHKVHCRVTRTRDTRTFATRRVLAFQIDDKDGSQRSCLECVVDFQITEPALLTYNAPPPPEFQYGPLDRTHAEPVLELKARAIEQGRTTRAAAAVHGTMFDMMETYFDWNLCLDGVSAHNIMGLVKDAATPQDHLPIHDKSTSEWYRVRERLPPSSESPVAVAALVFLMDGGLNFLPLHHDHKDHFDAGACSTLEFALRVLVPSLDLNAWHLRERKTVAAAGGRTYSEGRLWDEKGQMVAIATHTSILRPAGKDSVSARSKI